MSALAPPATIQITKSMMEWRVTKAELEAHQNFGGPKPCMASPDFRTSPDSRNLWTLKLYPHGDNTPNNNDVSLYLYGKVITDPVRVKYRMGLITNDGEERNVVSVDRIFTKAETWGWPNFIRRDVLLDPTKNFFRDDQVTFFCDITEHINFDVKVPESSLMGKLSGMLQSGDFSDAVLVVGKEELKAHKNVLAAGSEVFKGLLMQDITGAPTTRIIVQGFDVVVVKALLDFFYSGEVKNLKAIAEKVLPAAEKYEVEGLKLKCEKDIGEKLTIANAVDTLKLSENNKAKHLKTHVLAFMSVEAAEILKENDFWKLNETHRDLYQEAITFMVLGSPQNQHVKRRRLN